MQHQSYGGFSVVESITRDGPPRCGELHAQLMGSPRFRRQLEECPRAVASQYAITCDGELPLASILRTRRTLAARIVATRVVAARLTTAGIPATRIVATHVVAARLTTAGIPAARIVAARVAARLTTAGIPAARIVAARLSAASVAARVVARRIVGTLTDLHAASFRRDELVA
jgi:hypothetical protein